MEMSARPSLLSLIRVLKIFLPLAIVLVVVLFEVFFRVKENFGGAFWPHLAFYGIAGPLVTWLTLGWIYQQIVDQEKTQSELEAANQRHLLTLYEVNKDLRAEGNLENLLSNLSKRIVEWTQAEGGGVYLLDEDGMLSAHAVQNLEVEQHAFVPEGNWKTALERATFVENNLLALPLGSPETLGLLVVKGEEKILSDKLLFMQFLSNQVSLAIRNAQAYLRAEELALTEERNRIAREIHDGIAQTLAFMALKLDLADRIMVTDADRAKAELETVRSNLRAQIREVRRSIFALRPIDLERFGFIESARKFSSSFAEQAGLKLSLSLPEKVTVSQASELVLFRVLQEALSNSAKHAKATTLIVELESMGDRGAKLLIKDDGTGLKVGNSSAFMGGYGLTQMRERVEARGGKFNISSGPEGGTSVSIELPY